MVSKEILIQYSDLQQEIIEIREKGGKLNAEIKNLEKAIKQIEEGETVKDKVRGGLGGLQNFNIEGVPFPEYEKKKTNLMMKKLLLSQRKSTLEILEFELLKETNDVEEFISSLDDSRMRRIITFRFIDNLSWNATAHRLGGNATADSVRMEFNRYIEKS